MYNPGKLREEDLEETFTRSGGKGGQNVNKVSTAVQLRHIPTGVTVRCEDSRSQAANRWLARQRLAEKLEALERQARLEKQNAIEKARRASRRPSAGAKRRMLDDKKRRAHTKSRRSKVGFDD